MIQEHNNDESHVTPQENADLVQHYLTVLRLRKEETLRNHQPTEWELLSHEEKLILACYHSHLREEENLDALITSSSLFERTTRRKKKNASKDISRRVRSSSPSTVATSRIFLESNLVHVLQWLPTPNLILASLLHSKKKTTRSPRVLRLRGLLEAPTRPCGRKSTSEQGGGVQYVDSPREISGDPNQQQSPSDPSQPTVPSELVSVKTGGGLGDGSRRSHPRILGSYPETPYITHGELAKMPKADQIRILVKEHVAHSKECQKEALLGATPRLRSLLTGAQASQKALQKLIDNEEIEKYVKGWNPWEEKKTFFPSAAPKKDVSRLRFRRNTEQGALHAKLAHTLLDSLDAVNLNLNTLDLNSETNLKTLVNSISTTSFEIKKNLDENVNKILNKLHQSPLPLAYAMTNKHSEIIASVSQDMKALKENEEENRTNSQEIVREIKELKLPLINNSDNIISSLREDAIIEKQQQNSFLEEFKKIMINQNKNMSNNFNAQISALNNEVTALNNKIEQISNFSPSKEEPLPNPWSQRVEQSPKAPL
ncbi:hypothetical protein PSHT_03576 [Puccinia striiformis]|uniref:Uncharacterized protein n=1 Tax=Puccinia striiformis TaxID=27350 RepID=A0A2S4WEZ3_9BASI|nr:hypothetical protein PSHT_03576 [Puccinia striiformis]